MGAAPEPGDQLKVRKKRTLGRRPSPNGICNCACGLDGAPPRILSFGGLLRGPSPVTEDPAPACRTVQLGKEKPTKNHQERKEKTESGNVEKGPEKEGHVGYHVI